MLESLQLIHIYISSILHIVFSAKTFTIQAEPALIQICLHVCLQEMDDLFGSSGVGSAPEGTVRSTSLFPHQHEGSDSQEQTTNRPSSRRQASLFNVYEDHAERRTSALEVLVRPDLERERRRERRQRIF